MASSTTAGKGYVKKIINGMIHNDSFRLLDLGCGRGTYARLVDKPCYKIGVDAIDYRKKFSLMDFYDEFYQHDIRDVNFLRTLGRFNLSIAGDVLEHMTIEEAQKVLSAMQEISDAVIVAVPYIYKQTGVGGNHWEDHVQNDLTPKLMKERYPSLILLKNYNKKAYPWNGGAFYGYYAWAREVQNGEAEN